MTYKLRGTLLALFLLGGCSNRIEMPEPPSTYEEVTWTAAPSTYGFVYLEGYTTHNTGRISGTLYFKDPVSGKNFHIVCRCDQKCRKLSNRIWWTPAKSRIVAYNTVVDGRPQLYLVGLEVGNINERYDYRMCRKFPKDGIPQETPTGAYPSPEHPQLPLFRDFGKKSDPVPPTTSPAYDEHGETPSEIRRQKRCTLYTVNHLANMQRYGKLPPGMEQEALREESTRRVTEACR